jgi:hypothetical protein
MVFVALHHAHHALHMGAVPLRIVGKPRADAVRLEVGFVHYVKAVFIAEFVPAGMVGIMGRAHGVEVEALHQEDVLQHAFLRHVFAGSFIVLMPVYPVKQHRCTIHQHPAAVDLHLPEAHFATPHLGDFPVWLFQGEHQGVQVRVFRRPFQGFFTSAVRSAKGALPVGGQERFRIWATPFDMGFASTVVPAAS